MCFGMRKPTKETAGEYLIKSQVPKGIRPVKIRK